MARRSATKAAPAALPLDGYSIATSGRFPGTTQAALQSRITSLGATIASSVTADTNFLIATEKDFESNSTKSKAATTHNVPVVTLDWLEETESSNVKADETKYLLSSSAAPAPAAAPATAPTSASAPTQANGAKKRAASSDTSPPPTQDAAKSKKRMKIEDAKVGEGSLAKSKKVAVSVDEYCPNSNYGVYIDGDGLIWDASLNQTNASANNNKFYKVQLIQSPNGQDFKTWTRWGRVGERGQMALLGDGSLSHAHKKFEEKFKDKSGLKWEDRGQDPKNGKYAYVERNYNPESDDDDDEDDGAGDDDTAVKKDKRPDAKSALDKPTQSLMELIFNQQYFADTMKELNYDANKLPLGKLSKGTIARGFQALKDLSAAINVGSNEIEQISNRYYSVIPHAFGRDRPPIISTSDLLKKEIDLLESLSDMKEAAAMLKSSLKDDSDVHRLDRQFQTLGMNEMQALSKGSEEFTELSQYLTETKGSTHSVKYAVQDIFRIERQGEFERFDKSPYSKIASNRRLLWHGSRVTNFAGILGQGLRIAPPEAPVSGYMFGKGIYLADMSSKSANYCCSYNSGGTALLLLCEAELGDPVHELLGASYSAGEDAKANGMCSTWGKGRVGPSQWKDAGCVHPSLAGTKMPDVKVKPGNTGIQGAHLQYNEFIAYDVAQVRLRYLFRVHMG